MAIRIRSLEPDEWATYRAVRLAALQDSPDAFGGSYIASAAYLEQQWRQWCGEPSWFAFDGAEPVGMVRVFAVDGDELPLLASMWVAPRARGGSAASDLASAVIDWARDSGARGIGLSVIDGNVPARRLYERMGFVDNGVRERLPDGRVELGMELRLR